MLAGAGGKLRRSIHKNLRVTIHFMKADMKNIYRELKALNGKNAIVARGIAEHFNTGDHKLRACQEAAVAYAQDLGVFVIPSTTSRIGRLLRDAGVFEQLDPKQKRTGYTLEAGPNLERFLEFLDDDADYGTRITGSINEDLMRNDVLNHLDKHGAIRANNVDHKIDKVKYKLLAEKMMKGDLDVIFVPKGMTVAVKHNDETKRVKYYA